MSLFLSMARNKEFNIFESEKELALIRNRIKLLIAGHHGELQTRKIVAKDGETVIMQGAKAEQVLLLTRGKVAIELNQNRKEAYTLAILEGEQLFGEMALLANGIYSADVKVIGSTAEFLAFQGEDLVRAMIFDSELMMELLALVCERFRKSNEVIGLMLEGLSAIQDNDENLLKNICAQLKSYKHSFKDASSQLDNIFESNQG